MPLHAMPCLGPASAMVLLAASCSDQHRCNVAGLGHFFGLLLLLLLRPWGRRSFFHWSALRPPFVLQHTVLRRAVLRHAVLRRAMLRHAVLRHAGLRHAVLRHAVLCHAALCFVTPCVLRSVLFSLSAHWPLVVGLRVSGTEILTSVLGFFRLRCAIQVIVSCDAGSGLPRRTKRSSEERMRSSSSLSLFRFLVFFFSPSTGGDKSRWRV